MSGRVRASTTTRAVGGRYAWPMPWFAGPSRVNPCRAPTSSSPVEPNTLDDALYQRSSQADAPRRRRRAPDRRSSCRVIQRRRRVTFSRAVISLRKFRVTRSPCTSSARPVAARHPTPRADAQKNNGLKPKLQTVALRRGGEVVPTRTPRSLTRRNRAVASRGYCPTWTCYHQPAHSCSTHDRRVSLNVIQNS